MYIENGPTTPTPSRYHWWHGITHDPCKWEEPSTFLAVVMLTAVTRFVNAVKLGEIAYLNPILSVAFRYSTCPGNQPPFPHDVLHPHRTTMALFAALSALSLSALANAHGHVAKIVADGVEYPGAVPGNVPADSVGWTASNLDNGFVAPDSFSSPDIICHKEATPASASATVAAGGTVTLTWNTWPDSHHGPVIDYLASCNGDCASVDKTSLSFAKIDEEGLISGDNPGHWASDELMANGMSWTVTIPSSVAPGNYVLRHEILALHSAGQPNGAQAYPQCINLEVTGSGSATPSGESATSFYTPDDPGILFNLYEPNLSYTIPGPALWSG